MSIRPSTPRGIRNNNPGNVRYDNRTLWVGLDNPPSDGAFCVFTAPVYGLRVISKLLVAYQLFHNCHTVTDFIHRWAPPNENDTGAYVAAVAKDMSIDPLAVINLAGDPLIRARMVYGIVHHENGEQPYPMSTLITACELS